MWEENEIQKLWVYGCSWTNYSLATKMGIRMWPEIVGEYLKIPVYNNGLLGQGTSYSTMCLMRNLSQIKRGDVIIFQFSYPNRLMLPYLDPEKNYTWAYNQIITDKTGFFKHKKYEIYLDFITIFRYELLMKEFLNVLPIFDYIEEQIGATVKYWFINILVDKDYDMKIVKSIENTVLNLDRCIVFGEEDTPFKYNIEADKMVNNNGLCVRDEARTYNEWKNIPEIDIDRHPGQSGHAMISKYILQSIDPNINTDGLSSLKIKKNLL